MFLQWISTHSREDIPQRTIDGQEIHHEDGETLPRRDRTTHTLIILRPQEISTSSSNRRGRYSQESGLRELRNVFRCFSDQTKYNATQNTALIREKRREFHGKRFHRVQWIERIEMLSYHSSQLSSSKLNRTEQRPLRKTKTLRSGPCSAEFRRDELSDVNAA